MIIYLLFISLSNGLAHVLLSFCQLPFADSISYPYLMALFFSICVIPGMSALPFIKPKIHSVFSILSVAFLSSLGLILAACLIGVGLKLTAHQTLFLIGASTIGLSSFSLRNSSRLNIKLRFDSVDEMLELALAFLLIILSYWLFQKGDLLTHAGSETALHLSYIRLYAEGGSLDLKTLGLEPTQFPYCIFLWEYCAALMALAGGIDAGILWLKLRAVSPILVASGSYWLFSQIITKKKTVLSLIAISICLSASRILSLENTLWDNLNERMAMGFFTSVHHSDIAMDALFPMVMSTLIVFVKSPNLRNWIFLIAVLILTTFFHVREFFQAAISTPILFAAIQIVRPIKIKQMCWLLSKTVSSFLLAGIVFLIFTTLFFDTSQNSELGREDESKSTIIKHMKENSIQDLFRVRSLARQNALSLNQESGSQHQLGPIFALLILASLYLLAHGSKRVQIASVYTFFTVFLIVNWEFSRHVITLFTYSEMLMAIERFVSFNCYFMLSLFILDMSNKTIRFFMSSLTNCYANALPIFAMLSTTIMSALLINIGLQYFLNSIPFNETLLGYTPLAGYALALLPIILKRTFPFSFIKAAADFYHRAIGPLWIFFACLTLYSIIICYQISLHITYVVGPVTLLPVRIPLYLYFLIGSLLALLFLFQIIFCRTQQMCYIIRPLCPLFLALILIGFTFADNCRESWKWLCAPNPSFIEQLHQNYNISEQLRNFIRESLPTKSAFYIEPLSTYYPSLVSGVHTIPAPVSSVKYVQQSVRDQRANEHALYPSPNENSSNNRFSINEESFYLEAQSRRIDYLFVSPWFQGPIIQELSKRPDRYAIIYEENDDPIILKIMR